MPWMNLPRIRNLVLITHVGSTLTQLCESHRPTDESCHDEIRRFDPDEENHLEQDRIHLTQSLKALPKRHEDAQHVTIEIQEVDGHNVPLRDLHWSIDNVRLETKHP